ncbi:uncharacterized protein MCYG_02380 [Microsporum canis CBS 113480]|uniref:Hydrophobin n=1 Tax=Arthroderma otae (strain ATCC MYA-4605 / CBS 113480) TaxID=554155 RepID=C5FJE0_ARTOC|nr:uncharacterized protein MCYG_02380 [Microsporum canis CBS 113480]EEQ29561.1 predicted protein [Microsporum canis CBS 113480]
MKFLYTSSLVSLCLLLSSTAASPAIRPGSTTLSPVPEPEVQAQNVPNDMASRPTPAKPVAQPESSPQAEALREEDVESSSSEDELLSGTHRVHKASPEQGNLCKTGDSYCCNEEHGKNTCVKSRTSCEQKVICCNNDHGYQFCMGDINFNMPITFNINFDF